MKKFLAMALIAAVSAVGLALAPAQSAEAAPKKQCIYMIGWIEDWGDGTYNFSYLSWKKKGRKIIGHTGMSLADWERQRLTYQPRKNRAVGVQVNSQFGNKERITIRTVGKGKNLRAVNYDRVSKKRFAQLTKGYLLGVPGCKA